jgi:hypothetical protein
LPLCEFINHRLTLRLHWKNIPQIAKEIMMPRIKIMMLAAAGLVAFAAVPVMAADLVVKAPVYKAPPAPVVTSNFYMSLGAGAINQSISKCTLTRHI